MNVIKILVPAIMLLTPSYVLVQEMNAPSVNIHMAALQGDLGVIQQHIDVGSNMDAKDAFGSTPLIIAALFGHTEIAEILIEAGADMTIGDAYGSTPLHIAALFCRTEIVKAMLDNGVNKYARNSSGSTAFDIVQSPFEDDKEIYDDVARGLGPMGLRLDYEYIKATRPKVAEMLRPGPEDLETVVYAPLSGDDWRVSSPAERGLDPMLVQELYFDATQMDTLLGLLVIKDGYLIAEGYFNQGSIEQKARLQSVTKSFTSALVGVALDNGCLSSVDQKIVEFFPEIADSISDPRKKEITIQHLLQMRGGYPWEETDTALWDDLLSGIYPPLIEKISLLGDPGTQFNYSNLTSSWLGIIIDRACGARLKSYAEERLFSPLGIEAGEWGTDAEGHNNGCGDLHMRARDAAKFGLLYLNDGVYDGKRILPADWVHDSLEDYSEDAWVASDRADKIGRYFRELGYGYQWWSAQVGERRIDYAAGHGGQLIILLDDLNMVIVTISEPFYLVHDSLAWKHEQATFNLVGKFIKALPMSS